MTLKGAIRSYNAAVRRAERETAKRERERARQYKAQLKQQALDDAESDSEEYAELMDTLLGFHKEVFSTIQWDDVLREPEPKSPSKTHIHTMQAQAALDSYSPNFFLKMLGMDKSARLALSQKVTEAIERDSADYAVEIQKFNDKFSEWKQAQSLSKKVLDGEASAYFEVLKEMEPFNELKELGTTLDIEYVNRGALLVNMKIKGDSVIPTESKELLKSGKLSVKKVPEAKINSMFQDHICSAILGVASEIFSMLPVTVVYVNARIRLLDSATGHMRDSVIVSAMVPKATLGHLAMDSIDPSDAMKNFKCNMNFKPSNGFSSVDEIRYGSDEVA